MKRPSTKTEPAIAGTPLSQLMGSVCAAERDLDTVLAVLDLSTGDGLVSFANLNEVKMGAILQMMFERLDSARTDLDDIKRVLKTGMEEAR